jgi:hypothetical protein
MKTFPVGARCHRELHEGRNADLNDAPVIRSEMKGPYRYVVTSEFGHMRHDHEIGLRLKNSRMRSSKDG